jgi:DNA-binding response OmpR family regulator
MRAAVLMADPAQSALIRRWLTAAGHMCHGFARGGELMRAITRDSFDLVVLDLELRDVGGELVLSWVRAHASPNVAVLAVAARQSERDMVSALKAGADEYFVKPLSKAVFLARIEALGRRTQPPAGRSGVLRIGEFEIDLHRRALARCGSPVGLSPKDFDLAVFLFRNIGRDLSRAHILESVWRMGDERHTRTVDTYVSRIRGKLRLVPEHGWRLSAVYQYGYRLDTLALPSRAGAQAQPAASPER